MKSLLMKESLTEFSIIERYFQPLAGPEGLCLRDDAAVFRPVPGCELVISTDMMVEGVHFLPTDPQKTLGQKILRYNLSDLAAMGARPVGYLLTLCCSPHVLNSDWLLDLTSGLAEDQKNFRISLFGGDTVSTVGPLTLSVTVFGDAPIGQSVRRCGAKPEDELWVTGTIGDAAAGLRLLTSHSSFKSCDLTRKYWLPEPRLGLVDNSYVNACLDISDGLIQDAGHLADESKLQVLIQAKDIPLSEAVRSIDGFDLKDCLTGGDDYELLMAVSPDKVAILKHKAIRLGVRVSKIGVFKKGPRGVRILDNFDNEIIITKPGWQHF